MARDAARSRSRTRRGRSFNATPLRRPGKRRLTSAARLANLVALLARSVPTVQVAEILFARLEAPAHAKCRPSSIPIFALLIPLVCGSGLAHAQSGSAGGSIGNDEKSLSGSRAPESSKAARRSEPEADKPRRAGRKSGGGGGDNFDGAWIVSGVGVTCQGTSSNAVVVTSGKIIGETARGTVSPDGRV